MVLGSRRLRLLALFSVPVIIILLMVTFYMTDVGREWMRNAWAGLNNNVITLEDGVVAEFKAHKVLMEELEDEMQWIGTKEDALIRVVKNLMVYEEALTRGFVPVANSLDREAQYNVMYRYFDQLIGDPVLLGGAEYKKAMSYYLDLSFERYKHEVLFNKKYQDTFNFERIFEWGGKEARLANDEFAAFRGTQLLTENTPAFFPEDMTVNQAQGKLAYEFLYQEALAKGYSPRSNDLNGTSPSRTFIEEKWAQHKLTDKEYDEQLRLIGHRESVIRQYLHNLYPDTFKMNEDQFQQVVSLVGEERIQRYKNEIVINERLAAKYDWTVSDLLDVPQGDMPNYVMATYRDHQIMTFDLDHIYPGESQKNRFNRTIVDESISMWILAEMAMEQGFDIDDELVERFMDAYSNRYNKDELKKSQFEEYTRLTGVTNEDLWQRVRAYGEASSLGNHIGRQVMEEIQTINPTGLTMLDVQKFKEVYKQYWDVVIYNPKYSFVED